MSHSKHTKRDYSIYIEKWDKSSKKYINTCVICGAILGCMEQFYNGKMFNVKEFWVKNGMRGQGLGTQIFTEFEKRLKEKQVEQMILFTSRGDFTEHFYHKQNMKSNPGMIFMEKRIER